MTRLERKQRAKELEAFLGEYVTIPLKNINLMGPESLADSLEGLLTSSAVEGYVIDISENYIYLGETPDGFDTAISIDEIGLIKGIDNVPEELKVYVPEGEDVH